MASLKSSLTVYLSEIDALFVFLEKVFIFICFRQIMSCIKNLPKLCMLEFNSFDTKCLGLYVKYF